MEYLVDLISRFGDDSLRPGMKLPEGVLYQSELTVSWAARNEAGTLTDPKYIEPLKKILEKEKDTKRKINAFNILTQLAGKNEDHTVPDFVLNLIKKEKTRWVQDSALRDLTTVELDVVNEKEYLFQLIQHKDWQIVWSALKLLKRLDNSYSPRIEDDCLGLLEKLKSKPHDIDHVCSVLSKHGSSRSIDALKQVARENSKAFAVNSALRAIQKISGSTALPFFIEIFETNKNNDVKSTATQMVCAFGNEEEIDMLIKRAKSILSKERRTNIVYIGTKPEIVHILEFLLKFDDKRVSKLVEFISASKIDFLDKTEREWFDQNVKTI